MATIPSRYNNATELDVIITPRGDLPTLMDDGSGDLRVIPGDRPASVYPSTPGAAEYRRQALVYLALAEHLEAHPPVNEADVATLAKVLAEHDLQPHAAAAYNDMARRLVRAGVRPPQAGEPR